MKNTTSVFAAPRARELPFRARGCVVSLVGWGAGLVGGGWTHFTRGEQRFCETKIRGAQLSVVHILRTCAACVRVFSRSAE